MSVMHHNLEPLDRSYLTTFSVCVCVCVYSAWDPQSPRSDVNFNPFERNADGNAADCSGFFPGEAKYKDPMRPDASFEIMMAENAAMAEINADPKTSITGAPGCLKL